MSTPALQTFLQATTNAGHQVYRKAFAGMPYTSDEIFAMNFGFLCGIRYAFEYTKNAAWMNKYLEKMTTESYWNKGLLDMYAADMKAFKEIWDDKTKPTQVEQWEGMKDKYSPENAEETVGELFGDLTMTLEFQEDDEDVSTPLDN